MVESRHTAGFWPSLTEPFRAAGARLAEWFAPAAEAKRAEAEYIIRMELPGVKPADIDVSVHDGAVTVKGEKRAERSEEGESWFFSERQYGAFERSFRLPPDADADGVTADVEDGLLVISVPRRGREAGGARRVPIGG
jgi:HSP20 family protein